MKLKCPPGPASDDISLEKAAEIVSNRLYKLLRWILEGDKGNNPISFARENINNEELNTEIYISSHGQKDIPKTCWLGCLTTSFYEIKICNTAIESSWTSLWV